MVAAAILTVFLTACSGNTEVSLQSEAQTEAEIIPEETSGSETEQALTLSVNGQNFTVILYENDGAEALKTRLPFTLDMSEMNGNEKYYYMDESLPTESAVPNEIHTGDLMLYGSDCLVLFFEDFSTSYSYTPLGYMEDPQGLRETLGDGDVKVSFMLAE